MRQGTLPLSGPELRNKGAKRISEHAPEWSRNAARQITALAREGYAFTAEDLLDCISTPPPHGNAVGAAILHAVHEGVIYWTGKVVASKRPSRRGGFIKVWRGQCS